mgnify:CR=1 FL=1
MEKVIELAAVYYNTALKLISENKISKAIKIGRASCRERVS